MEDEPTRRESGYYGSLNPDHQAAYEQLLAELPRESWYTDDPRYTTLFLLRFCRARNFDVPQVIEMLRKDHEWRSKPLHANATMTVGEMLAQPTTPEIERKVAHIKRHYSTGYHGVDRHGRPMYIDRFGQLDMPGLLREVSETDIIEHFVRETEAVQTFFLPCCTLHADRVVETTLNVMDLKGFSFASATNSIVRRVGKELMQIPQDHYPETMGALYVFNPPKVFSIVWSIAQPMLNERTRAKIKFVNSITRDNPLLKDVAPENLPKWLGGTCECPGGCLSKPKGPWCDPAILKKLKTRKYYEIQSEHFTPIGDEDAETSLGDAEPLPSTPSSPSLLPSAPSSPTLVSTKDKVPKKLPSYINVMPFAEAKVRARQDYEALLAEFAEQEEQHMEALRRWSKIQLELTMEIKPYIINRAATYYDAYMHQKKCAKAVTESTQNFGEAGKEFERATQMLREVELQVEKASDPDERSGLIWKVCELADDVARWQRSRDNARIRASSATQKLGVAQARWNRCKAEHDYCTYNCSVTKAKKYYETYEEHEELLSVQMKQLEAAEERVAESKMICQYIRRQDPEAEEIPDLDEVTPRSRGSEEPGTFDEVRQLVQLETSSVGGEDWVSLDSMSDDAT